MLSISRSKILSASSHPVKCLFQTKIPMSSLVQHRLSQRRFQGSAPFFCYRFAVSSETVFQLRDFEFTRLSPLCQGVPLRLSLSEASSSLVIDLPPPAKSSSLYCALKFTPFLSFVKGFRDFNQRLTQKSASLHIKKGVIQ